MTLQRETLAFEEGRTTRKTMSNNKKRNKRIPPDVAAQYFSHLSNAAAKVDRDPPCSPEEVKALMGMFAEIMGMAGKKSSVSFMFGSQDREWPPSALAAAAKAASMYMPPEDFMSYEDDDEDDDDEEDDDDDEEEDYDEYDDDTKRPAIDPSEWKDLEQVARDEKREEEERENKAAKKREKKQRKKERLRREASEKAAEAAIKKQEKLATSWKSRVVAACQSHDATKLQGLLGESPFKKDEHSREHIDFLLPNCVAKTKDLVETGNDCRLKLADFIYNNSSTSFFTISAKTGRTSFHTACFVGDYYFVQFALERNDNNDDDDEADSSNLDLTCEESGFAPIHYAVLSGSRKVMDILMGHGCKVDTITDECMSSRDGKGITAIELAQSLLEGKHDEVTTVGTALSDTIAHVSSNRDRQRLYQAFLRFVIQRMNDVAMHGHRSVARPKVELDTQEQQDLQKSPSKGKKKKKKKKQQQQQQQEQSSFPASVPPIPQEDPMIEALLGMGFTNQQISDAARACGGTNRATADDLIMWIFAREAGEDPPEQLPPDPPPVVPMQASADALALESTVGAEIEQLDALQKAEEARLVQQRLAQKREEQRRRNREWNNREQVRQAQERMIAVQNAPITVTQILDGVPNYVRDADGPSIAQLAKLRPMPSGDTNVQGQKNGLFAGATCAPLKQPAPVKILTRPKAAPESINDFNLTTSTKKHPPGMESIGADFSRVGSSGIAEDATVSSLGSGIVGQNEWMNEADLFDPHVLTGFQGGNLTGATPLGFQFVGSNPESPAIRVTDKDPLAFAGDPNPMGEIRATARAFVPTNFQPPPGLSKPPAGLPVTSHSGFAVPELSSIGGISHRATVNAVPSLLPEGLTAHLAQQSYAPPGLNEFDQLLRAGAATSYSNIPSTTSSVTGKPSSDDLLVPPGIGLPSSLGLGGWENRITPLGSIHDPLSLGLAQPEPSSLWGGVAPTHQVAGAPLGGLTALGEALPSSSVFGGGAFGPIPAEQDDTNNRGTHGGGWGTTTSSSIW